MNPADPQPVLTYRADDVRLFMDCVLANRLHRGFWLTRLTYNATREAEDSYYRWALRRIELGYPTPRRLGRTRINAGLSEARNENPEYRQFPVTTHTGESTPRVAVSRSMSAKRKALQRSIARKTWTRSRHRRKLVLQLRRLNEAHARKSRTRTLQDAAAVTCGQRLVATEPNDMVRRLMGQIADPRRCESDPKRARMLRRRLHETGLNRRLNQIKRLCGRTGALHLMPEYRGTSQRCSICGTWVAKGLWVRTHSCVVCGTGDNPWMLDRDHNAGRNILAEALRPFIDSADPGGFIQALLDAEAVRVTETFAARENQRTRAIESWDRRGRRGSRRGHHPAEHQIELVPA